MQMKFNFNFIPISILLLPLWAGMPWLAAQDTDHPIQDNSFLVEEAYNQEFGVVQHISGFTRLWPGGQWAYTFTQEWPFDPSPRHQFSYTLSLVPTGDGQGAGLGDTALNYRYQLVGKGDTRVAFAPRLSVLLPTGDSRLGRGAGGTGFQTSLPLSVVVSPHLVTHWNVGATFVPHAHDLSGDESRIWGYNLGQSFVWLAKPRCNFLLETVWNSAETVVARGQTARSNNLLISPGIRWAIDAPRGLQIVPGIGMPIGVGPSASEKGVFLYLSFEHPYRKLPKH
jgi:hypothetical protein